MNHPRWRVTNTSQLAPYNGLPLTNGPLFREEGFSACLLGFFPG